MAAGPSASVSPSDALRQLLEGNQRFASGRMTHPNQDASRRREVASGQHPFAAILACADSRTGPEVVFDRGVGDLFVVRVAGNIADESAIESLDYSVKHLGVRLVMVLGHTRCGAVSAAVAGNAREELPVLMRALEPAARAVKGKAGDPIQNAVWENVKLVVAKLKSVPALAPAVADGELKIVGGVYDLETGKVTTAD